MAAVGDTLNGRYRLDRQIGRGGFARVFLGTDLGPLGRQVAIKVLNPELTEDRTFVTRFEDEARRVGTLEHPNILTVYDYGHVADTAYLVMPFVAGGTLQDRLASTGRLSLQEASAHLRQAAAALDYAHARNIVHRDVKPLNMLLREDGHLFLADFGIAKVLQDTQVASSSQAIGTIAYMAPEQFQGQSSPASDVYALGCVLFQLLTGEPPYTGPTQQVMFGHIAAPVPSVVERSRGQVPSALQGVIERALAKQPQDRFRSAGELAAAVQAVAEGRPYIPLPATAATAVPGMGGNPGLHNRTTVPVNGAPPAGYVTPTVNVTPHSPPLAQPIRRRMNMGWLYGTAAVLAVLLLAVSAANVVGGNRGGGNAVNPPAPTTGGATSAAPTAAQVAAVSTPTSVPPTATATATAAPTSTPAPRPTPTSTPVPPTATPVPVPGTVLYQADWSAGLGGWPSSVGWKAVSGMYVNDGTTSFTT